MGTAGRRPRHTTLIIMIESSARYGFEERPTDAEGLHIVWEIGVIHGGFLHPVGVGHKAITIMDKLEQAYLHTHSPAADGSLFSSYFVVVAPSLFYLN